jgi:hypothetical protein
VGILVSCGFLWVDFYEWLFICGDFSIMWLFMSGFLFVGILVSCGFLWVDFYEWIFMSGFYPIIGQDILSRQGKRFVQVEINYFVMIIDN